MVVSILFRGARRGSKPTLLAGRKAADAEEKKDDLDEADAKEACRV